MIPGVHASTYFVVLCRLPHLSRLRRRVTLLTRLIEDNMPPQVKSSQVKSCIAVRVNQFIAPAPAFDMRGGMLSSPTQSGHTHGANLTMSPPQAHELAVALAAARAEAVEAQEAARCEREASERERSRSRQLEAEMATLRSQLAAAQHAHGHGPALSIEAGAGALLATQMQDAHSALSAENIALTEEASKLQDRLTKARSDQHKLRTESAKRRSALMLERKQSQNVRTQADNQLELAISSLDKELAKSALLEAERDRTIAAERDAAARVDSLADENRRLARLAEEHAAAAAAKQKEVEGLRAQLRQAAHRESAIRKQAEEQRDEAHRLSLCLQAERQGMVREKVEERRRAGLVAIQKRQEEASRQVRRRLSADGFEGRTRRPQE